MTVTFWCLLVDNEGEPLGVPFVLRELEDCYLSEVADVIRKKTNIQVSVHHIKLWQADPPLPDLPSLEFFRRVEIEREAVPLSLTDLLGNVFPPGLTLPSNSIHMVAQLRSSTQSPFEIEVIDQLISRELESISDVVEAFLKNPAPPLWIPPDHATPSDREFLAALQIPSYRDGKPSLLFDNLHACDVEEVKKIFGINQHVCICNTAGSGKTRRILESLTVYWGFYFSVFPDEHGVGVRDLKDALEEAARDTRWTADLRLFQVAGERVGKSITNSLVLSRPLKKVLAARIVVFQLFLELVIKLDGQLEERHKRSWLFFQLSNPQVNTSVDHPFVQIIKNCFRRASTDALDTLIGRFSTLRQRYIPHTQLIAAVDEAQVAVRLYRHCFMSSSNDQQYRTTLREIVKTFSIIESIKLVLSGTGVTMEDLRESVLFGVSKRLPVTFHHNLGMFDTWAKMQPFLERYIPPLFLETYSGSRLKQRIREYLLGRYRFSVSFLEYFLMNGLNSPHTLLNEYIRGHTACYPGDSGHPYTKDEPGLYVQVHMSTFEWDRLRLDQMRLREASEIVQSHLTRGATPTYGPVSLRFVEYGIARFREVPEGHIGQIIEPLAFLSLMQWLQSDSPSNDAIQPYNNVITNIRSRLASPPSCGNAFEELVILYLLRTLRHPVPFRTIFNFHGTPPAWASEMAQISGRLDGKPVPVGILEIEPQNPGLSVHYAGTIQDILDWINNWTDGVAVLIPCTSFGPDIMLWCGDVLLIGQVKSYLNGTAKDTLTAQTMSKALESLCEDKWFSDITADLSKLELIQKLKEAIRRHRVLRFVAGSPLPFDLNSTANSVKKAIDALGPDVALASIDNIDSFRSIFITEDQGHLIEPLTAAFDSRKRKLDDMDV